MRCEAHEETVHAHSAFDLQVLKGKVWNSAVTENKGIVL
jgi:hypothetical protein